MAIVTARCTESIGVITRLSRARMLMRPWGHARAQTPQPRQVASRRRASFRLGWGGSPLGLMEIAATGQASTHSPQPLQRAESISAMKLVVWTGRAKPSFRAASMASQQQPQQLQMKFTRCWMFSPNWTNPRS